MNAMKWFSAVLHQVNRKFGAAPVVTDRKAGFNFIVVGYPGAAGNELMVGKIDKSAGEAETSDSSATRF